MTEKTYTVAGVSTLEGVTKIRFANDALRIKILEKNGHSSVDLVNLPAPMTKGEIALYLHRIQFAGTDAATEAAILSLAKKHKVVLSTANVTAETAEAAVA
jgi:hypothetical protein